MNDLTLIRKSLFRKKTRAILLILSIMTAFLIFGALASIDRVLNSSEELSRADRLVTVNKINFTQTMPFAYWGRVEGVDGVQAVTHASWFGGYFQDVRNFVQSFVVDMDSYLVVYPELELPADQRAALAERRDCVAVGADLAEQYEWSVGDRFPLSSNIWRQQDGSSAWDVEVCAILTTEDEDLPTNYLLMQYDYYNEALAFNRDQIGWMIMLTGDPAINDAVSQRIDDMFANSPAETETTTEAAFSQAFVEQLGNIGLILSLVVSAAFATILMIVGTTMVMAINERTKEVGVMKTLGFSSSRIFTHVLSESVLLSLVGGLLGLGAAVLLLSGIAQVAGGQLPGLGVGRDTWIQAFGLMIAFGLLTGFVPALNAMRLKIVDALGKE
ncbi:MULTISPECIES: ABC transporter permease [Oceanicaulis]|uniref:ABC transporter permease n=1 Tax=Oceanicaulis TaxID=153232 RepID=UPI00235558D9|nr:MULTISPECIES: ABC transporter permease [Oceanicaulis]|tara:strand:+ start:14223 stop:15380 length:1158 start_codon:yes stop_codon:yes gene_type:complete